MGLKSCSGVLTALTLILAIQQPMTALAREKAELTWKVDSNLYLHYTVAQTSAGEEGDPAPNLQYVNLFGYEIGPDGQFVALSRPWALEEVLFQLGGLLPATAMRAGDEWSHAWKFDNLMWQQPLDVSSTYVFTEVATRESRECAHITGTHKLVAERDATPRWTKFDLKTDAWFDHEAGRMLALKVEMRAAKLELPPVAEDPPVSRKYHWDAEWKLLTPVDSADTDYIKKKVDIAISRGVERLWAQRGTDGHWAHGEHIRGGTALSLLALLMCGEDVEDARIVESFRLLKETDFVTSYDVGVSIMAYEARYISKAEHEAFLKGESAKPGERRLSKEDLAEVQRLTDWLIANRNLPNVMWNYKRNPDEPARYDFSVTQYALLGLGAAMRCGATIPAGYVRELVEFTCNEQATDGPEVKRVIDFKPGKRKDGKKSDDRTTYSTRTTKARGWQYMYRPTYTPETGATGAFGSMTCAGITTLISGLDIAANMDEKTRREEFTNNSQYKEWEKDAQVALDGAMTWMELWFSVTRNPNTGRLWYYYYLYGLERVCIMADVRYLGTHDWYAEGAAALIMLQDGAGGWGGPVDTSFALLFLKRGTVRLNKPVYTGSPKE
jgi:hypothetical protein